MNQEEHNPETPDLKLNLRIKWDNLPLDQDPKEIEKLLQDHFQCPMEFIHSKVCDFCDKKLPFSFVSKACEDCTKTYDICEDCCSKVQNINICFRHN